MSAEESGLLDVAAAAGYLGVRESYVRRMIRERRLAVVHLGRLVRIERATLDALIESGRTPAR